MNQRLSTLEKPGDPPGEPQRRAEALIALSGAIAEERRLRAEAAARTAAAAEVVVWLGASLADLAGVTGHSRQAARKRWPGLGLVTRRRRWLSHHVEEVLWAAHLVLEHAGELPGEPIAGLAETTAAAEVVLADAATGSEDPARRWRLLDDLVDRRLRAVAGTDVTARLTDQAEFALHGARGVVAHFDHAVHQTVDPNSEED